MRIEPENGIITMTRGDTFQTPIYINEGTKLEPQLRNMKPTERLYVGVMEPGQQFEDAIIRKVYTSEDITDDNGNTLLCFTTNDTIKLRSGKYYYSIKLVDKQSDDETTVKTIVNKTLLWLVD